MRFKVDSPPLQLVKVLLDNWKRWYISYPTTAVRFEARTNPGKLYSLRYADEILYLVSPASGNNSWSSSHTCGEHACALWLWHSQPSHCIANIPDISFLPSIKQKKRKHYQGNVDMECLPSKTLLPLLSNFWQFKDSYVVSSASEV